MESQANRIVLVEFYARQVAVLRVAQAEQRKKAEQSPKGPGATPFIPTNADTRLNELAERALDDGIPMSEIEDFVDVLDGERRLLAAQISEELGRPA